jgi:Protein-disulfide isomerase
MILKRTMVTLATIVLVLSIFLCIHSISGFGLIGCSPGSSCNQVLGSRWSFLLGSIPVSALATGIYLMLLSCLLLLDRPETEPETKRLLYHLTLFLSGAIAGSAIWFIYLQHNIIHAFCPYCMTAHILGIILAILCIAFCARRISERRVLYIILGLITAMSIAFVQMLTTPRSLSERGFIEEQLILPDPAEMPVTGNPDAEHMITLLFDWQCSHCRKLHLMLPEVTDLMNDSVAFVCCPIALSQECNPYIPPGPDSFQGSCNLLRIGMALWNTDREAFRQYEEWYFSADPKKGWYPPSEEEALLKAAALVGDSRIESAIKEETIDNYISQITEIFGRTSIRGLGAIPRLIYNGQVMIPEADNTADLAILIRSLTQ